MPEVSAGTGLPWVGEGDDISFIVTRTGPVTDALDVSLRLDHARLRASQAELEDPAAGVTESKQVEITSELVETEFPAGSRSITITRTMPEDTLNTGDYTLSLTLLPGGYLIDDTVQTVWVQDDDRPTLTLSSTTPEYHRFEPDTYVTVNRTGDTSRRLPFAYSAKTTYRHPLPDSETIYHKLYATPVYATPVIDPGKSSIDVLVNPWFCTLHPLTVKWRPLGPAGRVWRVSSLQLCLQHSWPDCPRWMWL